MTQGYTTYRVIVHHQTQPVGPSPQKVGVKMSLNSRKHLHDHALYHGVDTSVGSVSETDSIGEYLAGIQVTLLLVGRSTKYRHLINVIMSKPSVSTGTEQERFHILTMNPWLICG